MKILSKPHTQVQITVDVNTQSTVIWNSLVDATRHVFNVFGFVLQAAVIVVGLHTRFNFTANGGTQLSAECTFLKKKQQTQWVCLEQQFQSQRDRKFPHHSFAPLDFLDDCFHVKVSKLSPWRGGQLDSARRKQLDTDRRQMLVDVLRMQSNTMRCFNGSYHALVVCSHFFGVVGVKHAPRLILLIAGVTEAAPLPAIARAGPKWRPVPLENRQQHSRTDRTANRTSVWISQPREPPYVGGALLVRSLWRRGAAVFWLAAGSHLASHLLEPSPASALRRWWVWIVGHASLFIWKQTNSRGQHNTKIQDNSNSSIMKYQTLLSSFMALHSAYRLTEIYLRVEISHWQRDSDTLHSFSKLC